MARDSRVLHAQMATCRRYLGASAQLAERAYSLAPGGSILPLGPSGSRKRDARFTLAVHAVLDRLPLHLRTYMPAALPYLPPPEALIVALVCVEGRRQTDVARAERITARTVHNRLDRALERLARLLWTDDGSPQPVGPPVRRAS